MKKRRAHVRITDFFKRASTIPDTTVVESADVVQIDNAADDEQRHLSMPFDYEEPHVSGCPRTSSHPFFTTAAITVAKRAKREAEYPDGSLAKGRWRRAIDAPLYPKFAFTTAYQSDLWPTPSVCESALPSRSSVPSLFNEISLPPLDMQRSFPSIVPLNNDPIDRFDEQQFETCLKSILEWIGPAGRSVEEDDDMFTWKRERSPSVTKKPIVFLSGPPGTGKSRMAEAVASHLGVPLLEINGAVSVRNGKPFDDILSGSHCQRSMMQNFIKGVDVNSLADGKSTESIDRSSRIKLMVLIDEVDLVFPQDKFYPSLNSFLRSCPAASILCLLTANADARLLQQYIDFPVGTLFCLLARKKTKAEHSARFAPEHSTDFEDVMQRSDFDMIHWSRPVWSYHERTDGNLPLSFLQLEYHQIESLPAFDHCYYTSDFVGDAEQLLLKDLHRAGLLWNCLTLQNWVLDYQSYWRSLEITAVERHKMQSRRICREKIRPRAYLRDVPEELLERLRQS